MRTMIENEVDARLIKGSARWLFGALGSFFLVLSIPRLLRYLTTSTLPKIIAELVWIALTGMLFEKTAEYISRHDDE